MLKEYFYKLSFLGMPPKTNKKSASGANGNAVEMNGLSKEGTLSIESNSPVKKEKIDEDSPQDV